MIKTSTLILLLLSGLFVSGQTIPSYVPMSGLKAYYGFSGDAHDWTGNTANDGVINLNVLNYADRNNNAGQAFYFTGATNSGHLDLPANGNLNFAGDFSLSFWVKTDSIYCSSSRTDIMGSNDYTGSGVINGFEIAAYNSDGHISYINWDGGSSNHNTIVVGGTITNGSWTHIACVSQGTQHSLYTNGSMTATASGPAMSASTHHIYMGYNPYQCGHLEGALDDVGIWDRALTQQEVTNLYNSIPLGISNLTSQQAFTVYPNPASKSFTLKTDAKLISGRYKIFDLAGKEVLSGEINLTTTLVHVDNLASGNYTVEVCEKFKQPLVISR